MPRIRSPWPREVDGEMVSEFEVSEAELASLRSIGAPIEVLDDVEEGRERPVVAERGRGGAKAEETTS